MNRGIAIVWLIVGIILLNLGYDTYHSVRSAVSETATAAPTDTSVWLLCGGLIATVIGGLRLIRMK